MKSLTTILALALAVGFAMPSLAAKGSMQKGAMQKSEKSAVAGKLASDFPRNRIECKKVGGSWSDQTNTCNEKKGRM